MKKQLNSGKLFMFFHLFIAKISYRKKIGRFFTVVWKLVVVLLLFYFIHQLRINMQNSILKCSYSYDICMYKIKSRVCFSWSVDFELLKRDSNIARGVSEFFSNNRLEKNLNFTAKIALQTMHFWKKVTLKCSLRHFRQFQIF